ncbi:MAG TPA: histidine kinase [Vicinamibacterales bacterium]|nr:histidine kinase [Vicinamibacterales bacterium]
MTVPRRILSAAAWTIGGSLAATYAFESGASRTAAQVALQTVANVLLSGPCVALCVFLLPFIVPFAHRRFPFPVDWTAIVVTLVVFGLIGSLAGGFGGIAIGIIRKQPFTSWYGDVAKVAVYFTVIFGLSATAVHELRARLASTTVALRTKERDEAEARRLAAEARLASLEARVDPHFLFNTLNSIAALVRENPPAAERVIEQLAALMRSSLDRGASLVTLDNELALVRAYLEIERVRFGDRLRFHIDAPAGVERALVPRMSLQTLAENAVKYAVSPARDGASVAVSAAADNGTLRLAVEDNGPGFDPTALPDGHGLHLLKSRLTMIFGERAMLTASSQPGRTCITLTLPFTETPPSTAEPVRGAEAKDATCL